MKETLHAPRREPAPGPFAAAVDRPLVQRRELLTRERLFVLPFLKALWFTFSRIFQPRATRQYPEVKLTPGATFHGVPVLVARENGEPRCVACGLCEFVCPPRAIDITPGEVDDPIERGPQEFVIDMLRCIECSYCEEVCPEEAIVMSKEYDFTGRRREDFVWNKQRLLRTPEQVKDRLEWVRKTYRRWDPKAGLAPPESGIFRDPSWVGRVPAEPPLSH